MGGSVRHIVVVGAGLSGLVAAYRLKKIAPDVRVSVLEAASRPGGLIDTTYRDGFVIEQSADSILREPADALNLVHELGLKSEVITTNSEFRKAYVVRDGGMHRIPDAFRLIGPMRWWPFLCSPLLSWRGKVRACLEPWVSVRQNVDDESFEHFVIRRYGRELYEYIAQPLVSGIYGVDPARLSMRATLGKFWDFEVSYGSVSRGFRNQNRMVERNDSGVRYGLFFSFRRGLKTLIDALAKELGNTIHLNSRVALLDRHSKGYRIQVANGETYEADGVVLATPCREASSWIRHWAPNLAASLSQLTYSSSVVVTLAFDRQQIEHPLDAFGVVVPRVEQRLLMAATFSSVKYAARAPEGKVLLRAYLDHFSVSTNSLSFSDEALTEIACNELKTLIHIKGSPLWSMVHRIPAALPQYTLGHVERILALEEELKKYQHVALAGNYLHGIGIPQVIKGAEHAARQVLAS